MDINDENEEEKQDDNIENVNDASFGEIVHEPEQPIKTNLDALRAFQERLQRNAEKLQKEQEEIKEEPVAEEAVVEEAVVEETVAEELIIEEPVTEEAVIEEQVAEEPVAEETVQLPQEEQATQEPILAVEPEPIVAEEPAVVEKVDEIIAQVEPEEQIEPAVTEPEPTQEQIISMDGGGGDGDNTIVKPFDQVMHESMLPYTEYVIMDRALPRVEDGLKPVQRRILYAMYEMGVDYEKPHKKCARIVGDCLGKYHPHGDKSVYDALVRMAQDFNMRATLVDGHGNFGSVDGDGAAAMRYTEARLAHLANYLLEGLDEDTVPFVLNFDDSLKEPQMLPGRFPNLLVNGASGIAVSLATNIPPHNLGEVIDGVVAYIDNRNIKLREMMKIIKGPDFPTGGYIIASDELEKAYQTGRGKIIMRAKIHTETIGERKQIVITELPYQTNKASLLASIAELCEEKKQTALGYISDIVDESDRAGMRAVIRLKKDAKVEEIIKLLFKHTGLSSTFGINIVAIADNRPQQMGLLDIIDYYVGYQREVILRRTKFRLENAKAREHILEGLLIAVKNIDEVIKIIKKSATVNDARQALRDRFKLSEKQAQAILDLRLARLTNLEVVKLQEELAEVREQIKNLTAILNNKKLQYDTIKNELLNIKKLFKSERRSTILKDEVKYEIKDNDALPEVEGCIIAVNANGNIKRISQKNYSMSQKEFSGTLHDTHTVLLKTQTDKCVLLFSNFGNVFKFDAAHEIAESKWKEKGTVLKGLASGERIIFAMPLDETIGGKLLAFFSKEGLVKFTPVDEYTIGKPVYQGAKVKESDVLINIEFVPATHNMIFVTEHNMALFADKSDVPMQGRVSMGVKGIVLADGDSVIFAGMANDKTDELVVVSNAGTGKRIKINELGMLGRARKGLKITLGDAKENIAFSAIASSAEGAVLGETYVPFAKIKLESRLSKGGKVVKGSEKIESGYLFLK